MGFSYWSEYGAGIRSVGVVQSRSDVFGLNYLDGFSREGLDRIFYVCHRLNKPTGVSVGDSIIFCTMPCVGSKPR